MLLFGSDRVRKCWLTRMIVILTIIGQLHKLSLVNDYIHTTDQKCSILAIVSNVSVVWKSVRFLCMAG